MKKAIITSIAIMLSANSFAGDNHKIDRIAEKLNLNELQIEILKEDFKKREIERKERKSNLIKKLELTPEQIKEFEKMEKKKKKKWKELNEINKD